MYNSLEPYTRYLKDMNLFTVSVEDFSQEMDGLKLYKRTFIGGQFALTVSAFGFLS